MEDKSAVEDPHSIAKSEKEDTGSLSDNEQPLKKKIKLDRTGAKGKKNRTLSNGVKAETKPPLDEVESKQDGELKSPVQQTKKEIKSPVKSPPITKPQQMDTDSEDDVPLATRSKTSIDTPSQSPSKPDHPKAKSPTKEHKNSHIKTDSRLKKSTSSDAVKKTKSSSEEKVKTDEVKKKLDGGSTPKLTSPTKKKEATQNIVMSTPKVEIKKLKNESPSVDGTKKPKSESAPSKLDSTKKVKSDKHKTDDKVKSDEKAKLETSKSNTVKKTKLESSSTKNDGIKKTKSEDGSKSNSVKKSRSEKSSKKEKSDSGDFKSDGEKKVKPESGTPKAEGVMKSKSETSESPKKVKSENSSVKVDAVKKSKSEPSSTKDGEVKKTKSDSSTSKLEAVKKVKLEAGSSDEKLKSHSSSSKIDVVKKLKPESSSSSDEKVKLKSSSSKVNKKVRKSSDHEKMKSPASMRPKVDGVKKRKSESSLSSDEKMKSQSASPKVDGVKKVKSEGSRSSSSDVDSKKKYNLVSPKLSQSVNSSKVKSSTEDSDDDMPLAVRVDKVKKEQASPQKSGSKERKRKMSDNEDDDDYKPLAKTKKKSLDEKSVKKEKTKTKDVKKEEKKEPKKKAEEEVWKWWEEEKHPEGIKWLTLEHKGPYFPPRYEPLPDSIKFHYNGKHVKLSEPTEEVAGFYAKMLDHDYTSKKIFSDNFFEDWRKEMSDEERKLITDLSRCDFKEMHEYYVQKNEERKNMSKEEKQKLKENNEEILQEYGYCIMDNHKERVGNFKIEPPGLFRGRGDHPKQGKLKKRVRARDVTINIGKHSVVPTPPEGQKWKAITHDNKVTWLACWIENIQGSYKYVMLNPTSRIKGEKDWQKYETARKLKTCVTRIRAEYTNDWKSKEMRLRQRGVALYFIDKLALRAGHEKDEDTADTVGCCSLRFEHIKLYRQKDEKDYVVEFDFLGKDSIHYHNLVEVDKKVFKNLELFKQGKSDGDDLFDRLSTTSLNKYLSELMEGLSAKVFRTYNASMTLQDQLNKLESATEDNVAAKVLGYNRANRAVAILCNHQRSAPKTFEQSMSNLQQKIEDKRKSIKEAKKEVKDLKAEVKATKTAASEKKYEKKQTALARLQEQLFKLEVTQTDKEENKEIALGTSKLNYLDPRISVSWCLKNDVPIEKIYNKTQRQKFAWAIDMTEGDFEF